MTELEFKALAAQGYNRIPLIAESFADLETPLSLYLKLANEPNTFLLESVVGGERFGRYSFIGLAARSSIRSFIRGDRTTTEIVEGGAVKQAIDGDPIAAVQRYADQFKVAVRPDCRASPVDWPAILATTQCESLKRSSRGQSLTMWACPTFCCYLPRKWQ